jgi:hypothetical protein
MFQLTNHHQGAYCCTLLKLYLLKYIIMNSVYGIWNNMVEYSKVKRITGVAILTLHNYVSFRI